MATMRKPGSKKKTIIIVIILLLILIAGGVVGFVLAMPKDSLDDVGISSGVRADVSAYCKTASGQEYVANKISLSPENNSTENNVIQFEKIMLDPHNASVEFTFVFENKDSVACRIYMIDNAAKNNVSLDYDIYDNDNTERVDANLAEGFLVGAGETWTIKQKIKVIDPGESAYYRSGDVNILYWMLEKVG